MTCLCRTGATCADHLAEADLTLEHVPMGSQTRPDDPIGEGNGASDELDDDVFPVGWCE